MDEQELYARSRQTLIKEAEFFADCSITGQVLRLPGIIASIIPATPDRSMFNWVIYDDVEALVAQYNIIVAAYEAAGVRAWTVWVDPEDDYATRFLENHGHLLDSSPLAMAAEMQSLKLPNVSDLTWSQTRDLGLVARINDQAYGFPPPAFEAALTQWPALCQWSAYIASLNGKAVSSVLIYQGEHGDCGLTGVATLPEARGYGIASRLLAVALLAAQKAGAVTTSLQASPLGSGVYAALGYRTLGTMGMWERRKTKPISL